MFTPQQIEQACFEKKTFGGYDMEQVDAFLEPLTEDYVTLYKENALLKSKMRVLVNKLEEYRKNEASMKDAVLNAQRTCDNMVREAEIKCAAMLKEANNAAAQAGTKADSLVAAEEARLAEARKLASVKIDEIEDQLRSCLQALERIKSANQPAPVAEPVAAQSADDVAAEISQTLEAMMGTTEDVAPKAEPQHPVNDTTTAKFTNLQFGRNYDPTHK
ncbi:MAG: DivIVA domain-containing protein [Oscillibacter sp.]|jgi:cell division initiation protein|nr:DivIVA domain-containing protein [Oscillibacter sp.]